MKLTCGSAICLNKDNQRKLSYEAIRIIVSLIINLELNETMESQGMIPNTNMHVSVFLCAFRTQSSINKLMHYLSEKTNILGCQFYHFGRHEHE